jgi:hypothetical protein
MPYIPEQSRTELRDAALSLGVQCKNWDELNYTITQTLLSFFSSKNGRYYEDYMEIIDTLECIKQEFYRRAVGPGEDIKTILVSKS